MFSIGFGEHDFRLRFLFDRSPLSAFASSRIALTRSSSSPGFRKGTGALAQIDGFVQPRRDSLAVGGRRCPPCCFGVTLCSCKRFRPRSVLAGSVQRLRCSCARAL